MPHEISKTWLLIKKNWKINDFNSRGKIMKIKAFILSPKYVSQYSRLSQKFCNILVCASLQHIYYMTEAVQAIDLKTKQMNLQCTLIWEFILYELELNHSTVFGYKNICCVKVKGTIDHSTITRWFKNFTWIARTLIIRQALVGLKSFWEYTSSHRCKLGE